MLSSAKELGVHTMYFDIAQVADGAILNFIV